MLWPALYLLDVFALVVFLMTYYGMCYRRGYRIDFWSSQVFLYLVIPDMLLLPFARSDLNALVLGNDLARVVEVIPVVFLINMIGFAALNLGGGLWRVRVGAGVRTAAKRFLEMGPKCSMMLMSSREVLVLLVLVCLSLQGLLLGLYFTRNGFGFDLRAYTFENPGLRPLAQITALATVVVASHCLARFVDTREKVLLGGTVLLSFGLLFFGQRTNIALVFMNVTICYLVRLRSRVNLFKVIFLVAGLIALVFYLGNVREGQYSVQVFLASIAMLALYGNTFCDLRDFAWVYSSWNHELWLGKTYLAGWRPLFRGAFRSFAPRGPLAWLRI